MQVYKSTSEKAACFYCQQKGALVVCVYLRKCTVDCCLIVSATVRFPEKRIEPSENVSLFVPIFLDIFRYGKHRDAFN